MSQLSTHTDDECSDARCPLHSNREWVSKGPIGAKECKECGFKPIHMIGEFCEHCYRKVMLDPIVAKWHAQLAELDVTHTELSERLSLLTQSSAGANFNMNITCQCGKVFNSGISMHKHLPECEGPKPKTVHKSVTARAVKINLETFTIG